MSHLYLDVHTFDGKLVTSDIKNHFSREYKLVLFNSLLSKFKIVATLFGFSNAQESLGGFLGLQMVMNDVQLLSNYDATNQVYADDILAEICEILDQQEDPSIIWTTMETVLQQMADMRSLGACSQGRCTRLRQIYDFLKYLPSTNLVNVKINLIGTEIVITIDVI